MSPNRKNESITKRNADRRLGQSTLSFSSNEDKDKKGGTFANQAKKNQSKSSKNNSNSLDFNEFLGLVGHQLGDRPKIIDDIAAYLTNKELNDTQ